MFHLVFSIYSRKCHKQLIFRRGPGSILSLKSSVFIPFAKHCSRNVGLLTSTIWGFRINTNPNQTKLEVGNWVPLRTALLNSWPPLMWSDYSYYLFAWIHLIVLITDYYFSIKSVMFFWWAGWWWVRNQGILCWPCPWSSHVSHESWNRVTGVYCEYMNI